MSADVLRQAAALMRKRAEAATGSPWRPILIEDEDGSADSYVISLTGVTSIGEDVGESMVGQDAEHIASWHPAVALAVADWLEQQAASWDHNQTLRAVATRTFYQVSPHALTVARTYLGTDA